MMPSLFEPKSVSQLSLDQLPSWIGVMVNIASSGEMAAVTLRLTCRVDISVDKCSSWG